MLQYLAQYLSGGPISDHRMISDENGEVTFWARPKGKTSEDELEDDGLRKARPFSLPGREFVRRWAMHILPKGFTRTRFFGGYSYPQRKGFTARCRRLRKIEVDAATDAPAGKPEAGEAEPEAKGPKCPRCQIEMKCCRSVSRPSWRDVFTTHATCPVWYVMPEPVFRSRRKRGPPEKSAA